MFQHRLSILAIDNEYLVAMEIERILSESFNCDVTIATPHDWIDVIDHRRFDLAVVDGNNQAADLVRMMSDIGARVGAFVLSTFDPKFAAGVPELTAIPVVKKPFFGDELIDVIRSITTSQHRLERNLARPCHRANACGASPAEAASGP